MLRNGPYPPFLQARISCDTGHLSNRQTGELLRGVAHPGLKQVVLAHLSQKNNAPAVALESARAALQGTRFRGALSYAAQDALTWPSSAGSQFELGF
jgi:phosphoribosyl 1,2-cyclic phosphodiesterase